MTGFAHPKAFTSSAIRTSSQPPGKAPKPRVDEAQFGGIRFLAMNLDPDFPLRPCEHHVVHVIVGLGAPYEESDVTQLPMGTRPCLRSCKSWWTRSVAKKKTRRWLASVFEGSPGLKGKPRENPSHFGPPPKKKKDRPIFHNQESSWKLAPRAELEMDTPTCPCTW